jgi:hypothetical protein
MIVSFKRYDGQALGADKLGENSGERVERVGEIPIPPPNRHKNKFDPKPNHLKTNLTLLQIYPYSLTQQMISKNW